MDDQTLRQKLTQVFREVFDNAKLEIANETTAQDVPDWDSLNHINLIVAIESAFGIRFTTADVANLANVGELIDVIKRKVG